MNKEITIYELLGLIKDGKAPKLVKYDNYIWKYKKQFDDYFNDEEYLIENGFDSWNNAKDFLEEKVEIIEDKSIIEKINGGIITSRAVYTNFNDVFKDMSKSYETIDDIIIKLNEVIDYINRRELMK